MNYPELAELLYHGSDESFSEIKLSKSAPRKDFGRGFYTTPDRIQAEKFARLKSKRTQAAKGYIIAFELQDINGLQIKKFPLSDCEWFEFVLRNRGYDVFPASGLNEVFDIIIGPVANDAVGVVLNLFVSGAYGNPAAPEAKETAIRLLLSQKLNNQVFFGTELAVSRLAFSGVYDVHTE